MPNIPKSVLYGLGIVFVAALSWFFYFDKGGASLAKLSAPSPAAGKK